MKLPITTKYLQQGASLVEYALLIALIAVVVIAVVSSIGTESAQVLSDTATVL